MSWNFCQPMQTIMHNENNFWNAKPYIIIIKRTKQKKHFFFSQIFITVFKKGRCKIHSYKIMYFIIYPFGTIIEPFYFLFQLSPILIFQKNLTYFYPEKIGLKKKSLFSITERSHDFSSNSRSPISESVLYFLNTLCFWSQYIHNLCSLFGICSPVPLYPHFHHFKSTSIISKKRKISSSYPTVSHNHLEIFLYSWSLLILFLPL